MPARILIADGDPIERHLLESLCDRFGYEAELAASGEAALARLRSPGPRIGLLILDLALPGLGGMAVLSRLKEMGKTLPVIAEVSQNAVESALAALRAGACDFIVKPAGPPERFHVAIKNALHAARLEEEASFWHKRESRILSFDDLGCESSEMAQVVRLAKRAAKSNLPVLLEGESGTGKETFARAIHGASSRRGRAFVAVNCASLPESDAEAILFGEGAVRRTGEKSGGKFAEAHGGTLFLDRVCELPLDAQAKLMRALSREWGHPAGARRPVSPDVRLISAASRSLIELVTSGQFREDLFYRINIFPVSLPPLRVRRGDIGPLARRFCARFAAQEGKRTSSLCAEAEALLCAYDWPGNVRQLENAVFRAVALADGEELTVAEFPQIAARVRGFDVRIPPAPAQGAMATRQRELVRIAVRDPNVLALLDECGNPRPLDRLEAEAIEFALAHHGGQMAAVARALGIGRSTLYRKLRQHGLLRQREPVFARRQGGALAAGL